MSASIVICTRNRSAALRRTLECLASRRLAEQGAVELLVVDNGSTDDTRQVVETVSSGLPTRYFSETRKGVAHARNVALEEFRGDYLVFIDDDIAVSERWLEALLQPVIKGGFDGAQGFVRLPDYVHKLGLPRQVLSQLANVDENSFDETGPKWIATANFCIARSALPPGLRFDVELGPGAMGFAEDTLFYFQLRTLGRRVAAAPAAWVEHLLDVERLGVPQLLRNSIHMGKSKAYVEYHWKHEMDTALLQAGLKSIYARRLAHYLRFKVKSLLGKKQPATMGYFENYIQEGYLTYYQSVKGSRPKYDRLGLVKHGGNSEKISASR